MLTKNVANSVLGKVKIRNGFNTEEACQEPGAGLSDLNIPGSEVDGNSPGECQQENAESFPEESEQKRKHDEDGFHVKGGGDSQPYNGHRWGLGCCHYVRQGAEEDTFRFFFNDWHVLIFLKRYPNDRFSSRLQHLIESSYVLQGGISLSSSSL